MLERINECLNENLSTFTCKEVIPSKYKEMKYPKLISFMKFSCDQKEVNEFGDIFIMNTNAMGGLMKLCTISFMPSSGKNVPFLLIDAMSMKDKRTVFVEYYDCTNKNLNFDSLNKIKDKYSNIPDYIEKDNWYVHERMNCSLIKGGSNKDEDLLVNMVKDSIKTYLDEARKAQIDLSNIDGLAMFREKMINLGNPSSNTLNKVLGEKEAINFFKTCVMPIEK